MMDTPVAKHSANVTVVVADCDPHLCEGLRVAMAAEGYKDIHTIRRLSAVRELIAERMVDLLVLDVDLPDGDTVALVRDIRRGNAGRNPFVSIIFVTRESDTDVIRRAVNSGVDLILIKPLSAGRLFTRIERLVADRKPFVVTGDYVGPDRRNRPLTIQQLDDVPNLLYDVPNTLKDKIEGKKVSPAALSGKIEATMQRVNGRRLSEAAHRLGENVDAICRAFGAGGDRDDLEYALAQASYAAKEIANLGNIEVVKLCASLKEIIDSIRADPNGVAPKQVALLEPLATSIRIGSSAGPTRNPVMQEISLVLWQARTRQRSQTPVE